jgi:hypothetical protein
LSQRPLRETLLGRWILLERNIIMKLKIIIYIFVLQGTISCNMSVDDIDPKASHTIEDSKQNGVFVTAYKCKQDDDDTFKIQEAWIEHVWKYEKTAFSFKVVQDSINMQFNLTFKNYNDSIMFVLDTAQTIEPNDFTPLVQVDSVLLGGWKQGALHVYYLDKSRIPENIHLYIGKKDSINEKKKDIHPYRELILSRE